MTIAAEPLRVEIEVRIKGHGFNPTVTYEVSPHASNVVVYEVDLPEEERSKYVDNGYFTPDQIWVKDRGRDLSLVAELRCKWKEE